MKHYLLMFFGMFLIGLALIPTGSQTANVLIAAVGGMTFALNLASALNAWGDSH